MLSEKPVRHVLFAHLLLEGGALAPMRVQQPKMHLEVLTLPRALRSAADSAASLGARQRLHQAVLLSLGRQKKAVPFTQLGSTLSFRHA